MKLLMKDYFSNTRKEFDVDLPCVERLDAAHGNEKCRGFYANVSNRTLGLAEYHDQLYVMLDGRAIEVDESLLIHYSANGKTRKLVIENGAEQLSVEYVNDNDPVSTQYYSEDEEDADFGLWLSGVLSSPERKTIVLNAWSRSNL